MTNPILSTLIDGDSYKFSHWKQYPPNTTAMYSYFESRGGSGDYTQFFGLQYYLKKYLSQPITVEMVEEAKVFAELHGEPFNYDGWMYIAKDLMGKIPVVIKAVPEGAVFTKSHILMSVESTDPKAFWVVSWFETLLVRLWYPISVATTSWTAKQIIREYLDKTSDDTNSEIGFKLHDFGSRGASSQESAMIGGAAHLVNFMGSDTVAGVWMANQYYNSKMSGFSIPASEHSTITMWGLDGEKDAYENMIKQYGSGNIFACVSDSYNIYEAVNDLWGDALKQQVLDMNALLVIRPDSGIPHVIVPEIIQALASKFGTTTNTKGYKVLKKVRVIQGDGITVDEIEKILRAVEAIGFSATNVAFGMGAGLLQKNIDRDTHKFAFKCSWAMVDGHEIEVYKSPITDPGKRSKKGKLDLINFQGKIKTVALDTSTKTYPIGSSSILWEVFRDGKLMYDDNLDAIRERAKQAPLETYTGEYEF